MGSKKLYENGPLRDRYPPLEKRFAPGAKLLGPWRAGYAASHPEGTSRKTEKTKTPQ
jgi:hypothetical protein